MTVIQTAGLRKLTGIEQSSLWVSNEFAPFNVVCVLRIEGALEAESLRRALAALQARHPLLRTRVVLSPKGSYNFAFNNPEAIPLKVLERKSPNDWIAHTEEELLRRIDASSGPLLQCTYLRNSGEAEGAGEIILTLNHAIFDASSAQPMLRELLLACNGKADEIGAELSGEGSVPATALFPRNLTGAGYVRSLISFMMRQMADEISYKWRTRGTRKPPINTHARNRILPIQLSKSLTEALVRATRRERITMNAILGAGFLLAVKRHLYPSIDTPLRNITFADLRPYLSAPVPEGNLGCFMGMCRFTILLQDQPVFWKLAREVHNAVYQSNRRGERFIASAQSPVMMKMMVKMKSQRIGATALSYAGPVSLGECDGPVRLAGVHAFISNFSLGPEYCALARLFQGEIWLDILYLDSDMNQEKAEQIAREIRLILEGAVGAATGEYASGRQDEKH